MLGGSVFGATAFLVDDGVAAMVSTASTQVQVTICAAVELHVQPVKVEKPGRSTFMTSG